MLASKCMFDLDPRPLERSLKKGCSQNHCLFSPRNVKIKKPTFSSPLSLARLRFSTLDTSLDQLPLILTILQMKNIGCVHVKGSKCENWPHKSFIFKMCCLPLTVYKRLGWWTTVKAFFTRLHIWTWPLTLWPWPLTLTFGQLQNHIITYHVYTHHQCPMNGSWDIAETSFF